MKLALLGHAYLSMLGPAGHVRLAAEPIVAASWCSMFLLLLSDPNFLGFGKEC